jgi:hypothetical protein
MKTLSLAALVLASAAWFPSVSMAQDKQEVPVAVAAVAAPTAVALDYYDGVWKRPKSHSASGIDMTIQGDSGSAVIWGKSACFRGKVGVKIVSRDSQGLTIIFKTTDIGPQCGDDKSFFSNNQSDGKHQLTTAADSRYTFTKQ